ncbi:alanine--tRNA ligase [Acinetobacter pollinis]|jgi:alanyl-tRNA synthetase|uniref:alanine--tRNA ligase n=1 Tax=Acinetobacter pollinis TaxID=2605270 RepID=UPI0018C26457|nr:alanine--tRNA ligase [Acinetobacter pollinis]MBF7693665.1 alanine--tRNA ligase [Acinetobacter pollinis]MBF7701275.1 alanine--tRNA ligase [Acinetobacter pollinis]
MTSAEIREAFLHFFETKGHTRVASSSLVPANDPTLLFNNAGMNQFKDCLLGLEDRGYTRATSAQKCVRAGGKHNDLDNVGYTARHHTFFEMLGNFSFGDYFKRDAIQFAWEFLTSVLKLEKDRLYVTIYHTDDEAFDIWNQEVGIESSRIIRIGDNKGAKYASDNFWTMGDTGPCGPCSEIFYDHGDHIWGGLPGTPEEDGDRFIEIWNIVFMQFNRTADGELHSLPAPSVDTGMGLERVAAVLQHVNSNYEIDIFQHLLKTAAEIVGIKDEGQPSLRVIADHARSCSFLIADGVLPGNEGRGYVLRRIIRRAIRHGHKLGATGTFFYKMLQPLIDVMGDAYPQLVENRDRIENALIKEEEQFAKTLEQGLKVLEGELAQLQGNLIPGEVVFKLYDTYGFPADLTADIARERDLTIDESGFETEMAAQRQRARDAGKFKVDYNNIVKVDTPTQFEGYQATQGQGKILAIYKDGQQVDEVQEGDEALIVLDNTPFYAESGGQVGDTGIFKNDTGIFEILDTQKSGTAFIHQGVITVGHLRVNQQVNANVEAKLRQAISRNHSATHLLHAALRKILGTHVEQKGSLVASDILRFDFSNDQPVTFEQLQEIERLVNQEIIANTPVVTEVLDIETAKTKGAMMLFGEKYGETVRVLTMGTVHDEKPFSIELCGGIHVGYTGQIGLFKITSEGGVAAGVRRIEAVTGNKAIVNMQKADTTIHHINGLLKAQKDQTIEKVQATVEHATSLQKQIEQLNQKLANLQAVELLQHVKEIQGRQTLIASLENVDAKSLRHLHDSVKSKLDNAVIVLAGTQDDKVSLLASVAKQYTTNLKAGDIIKHLASELGGKGGGKPDLAQGGAPLNEKFNQVIADLPAWFDQR